MVQMSESYLENSSNATEIIDTIRPILTHRYELYEKYQKKDGIPLEAYTTKVATGYLAGNQPTFSIKVESDEKKKSIITKIFEKIFGERANPDEFKVMVDYINDYNDLGDFFLQIARDYFSTGACTWLNYENKDSEQVFARVPSWQCCLIYDYSIPMQVIGAVRIYRSIDDLGNEIENAIITTSKTRRYFRNGIESNEDEFIEDTEKKEDILWYLTPVYGVENTTGALFEGVQTLIDKLEQCINNTSSIMDYNDLGCKLKVTGFTPQNPMLDEEGNINQDRIKEDKALLNAEVFYTPDQSGDISWIQKDINTEAVDTLKKTLLEYILMNTFIPNVTDEAFINADSNKALMKKFFGLQTSLQEAIKSMQKELLRMWENIIQRINEKKGTKFDFRDLSIEIQTNIPTDDTEVVDTWLKLTDLLSDETIISHLPFDLDVESELKKKKEEAEENMQDFYNNNANAFNNNDNKDKNIDKNNNKNIMLQDNKDEEK